MHCCPAGLPSLQLRALLVRAGNVTAWRKMGAVDAIQALQLQLFPSSLLCSLFPQRLRIPHPCPVSHVQCEDRIPPTQSCHRGLQVTSATHPGLRPPGVVPGLFRDPGMLPRIQRASPCAAARRSRQDLSPMLPAGTQPCPRPPGWEPGERPQLPSAFPSTETKPRRSRPSDPSLAAN